MAAGVTLGLAAEAANFNFSYIDNVSISSFSACDTTCDTISKHTITYTSLLDVERESCISIDSL